MDFNNEGHSRWHEPVTTHTDNECKYNPNDMCNNNEWPFHVPFADSNVSTDPKLCNDNLVQPADDILHSELITLQDRDMMGKEFISVTDVEEFYTQYSYGMGFSMRKDRLCRDTHGLITFRRWVCSKEGYRSKKHVDKTDRVREPRGQTWVGCRASFKINFDREKMLWVVTEFVTEHSHNLSPGNQRQFLRSHRNVSDSHIAQVQSGRAVGMKTSQVMDQLLDQSGSYAAVGHSRKDLQNRVDTIRRSASHNSDADSLISYMTAKSKMDPGFFFRYTILADGSMGNLFWSDAMSRCDYSYFGDVMSFDSTYRTNSYNRPLVIFVGVNNHTKTTIFGFGLLVDKTVETYSWILQTFLQAMHGKCPVSVVTDGDKAMSKALSSVMPSTVRRLCSWHLERNVQTNVGDTGFTQAFTDCMLTYMMELEFKTQWLKAIETFGLQRNDWVKMMYCKRKLWAETFLRGTFFGGLRSIQLSESINSFLNKFLHRRLKLYDFMSHIDRAMSRLRNNELKDDFDTINEHPVLVTHLLQLEKHTAEVYTRNTFHWVRDEIKSKAKHSIVNCVDDMDYVMYTFQKFAGGDKTWNVKYTPSTNVFKCSCQMFETIGIPNAKDISEVESSSTVTTPNITQIARYGALSSKCSRISYYASLSTEGYNEANVAIDKLTIQMKGLLPSSSTTMEENVHRTRTQSRVQVKDPVIAATKGSMRQNKNTKGKARKCGNCGQPGHTKKTCHAHVKSNISAMASNGGATISSTSQPTAFVDLVQSCDFEYIVDSDGRCQPFAFQNTEVPMGKFSNQLDENVFSMTTSTLAMYMQQNEWWRPHN
ncbi:hypothetical protein EZV62_022537 [Acer yangbiense]|uniref:CCHC-type domain-containing protein n=1 Tax=Acer yangbiense TaxID=1000413 RepID=A0A5C7H8L3_9ROSI|nr:hypothetical protein EZV62_022537 [Acer yangbiense]